MSDTTVNYTSHSTLSKFSQTEGSAATKQVAAQPTTPAHNVKTTHQIVKADQTSLSLASGLVSKALSLSDVRADKVASLQKAISAGTYNVSSSDVAGKLLQTLLG